MEIKPYKDGVTLAQIIEDGWARGFLPNQTVEEAEIMGYHVTMMEVENAWKKLDIEFEEAVRDL